MDFVRKAVRAIGRCAIKVEVSSKASDTFVMTMSQFFKILLLYQSGHRIYYA